MYHVRGGKKPNLPFENTPEIFTSIIFIYYFLFK